MLLVLLLVSGTKCDLLDLRQVPFSAAMEFADHQEIAQCIETSSKDNVNVEEAFIKIARVRNRVSNLW